jgi:hypothetical protein
MESFMEAAKAQNWAVEPQGRKVKKDEMGGECSTNGGEEECI